ncbi:MAG TPA: class I SAM-dependent methyltransferase [Patescibacteria group bacterium]|nr:class I SAM-dependent methyltransferase [Patescibacteria group bacterium]
MKLTPRLQAIADSINQYEILADIGTDHAYLPIYLMLNEKIKKAIATDINKGPIDIAQERIRKYKLEDKIETRQGSGLTVLEPQEADAIVIAGMGGMLIADIIEQSKDVAVAAKVLVMQPMLDSGKLRTYLMQNGFEIFEEELAKEDKKVYEIIWARYTGKSVEVTSMMDIGPIIIEKKHLLANDLIDKKIEELNSIIEKLGATETELSQKRFQECKALLDYYNEVKQWVQ